jgi:hypothetical protein
MGKVNMAGLRPTCFCLVCPKCKERGKQRRRAWRRKYNIPTLEQKVGKWKREELENG